jgi:hypothetical protein
MNAFPTIYRYICRKSLNDKFTNLTVTLARGIPNFWNPLYLTLIGWSHGRLNTSHSECHMSECHMPRPCRIEAITSLFLMTRMTYQ